MNKKTTKVLALFLAVIMSLPLTAFASLGIFAEEATDTTTETEEPAYIEPTVTASTVAYFSYTGNDNNDGLSAATMKKTMTPAWTILYDGGTLVIPAKGYVSANHTVNARTAPVLITAKDTDGTMYYDPDNPNVANSGTGQFGMFMIQYNCTLTFKSDVIFDDIAILQRAANNVSKASNILITNNSTLVIGERTQFLTDAASVVNTKLTVDEGSTIIVKAAGASSYNGAGKIFVDKNLVGNGIDASQFVAFTGELYDLDGKPLCGIVGHNYVPTVVNHTYKNICTSCGHDGGVFEYTTPVVTGDTVIYWSNGATGDGSSLESPLQSGGKVDAAINNGGIAYIIGKGYVGDNYSFDLGGATKFTAVLPDGTDYRDKTLNTETGVLLWPAAKTLTFSNDLVFEKVNLLSRNASAPVMKIIGGSTVVFDEADFDRQKSNYVGIALDIEAGSTVIINNNCHGQISSVTGGGTLIIGMDCVKAGLVTAKGVENFTGTIMTTESKEVCAFTGSHSYIDDVCEICGTEKGTATTKIYVAKNAMGDGLSPENPTNSLRKGFEYASADPIEIILVDDLLITSGIACQATNQDVTITSIDLDGDGVYPKFIIQSFINFYNEGSGNTITFKNIEIQSDRSGTVSFFMNYNNLVIGEGVTCTLSGNYTTEETGIGVYPSIYAGFLESAGENTVAAKSNSYDCNITVQSGTWRMILGGSRRNSGEYAIGNNTGDVSINIEGGTILGNEKNGVALAGTGENFYTGNVNINVTGGVICGDIYGVYDLGQYNGDTLYGAYGLKGDIAIDITGGTFAGDIYAKADNIRIPALIRGNVTVSIADTVTLEDTVTVDLRGTVAYAGKTAVSSLTYDDALSEYIVTKFIDLVNDAPTNDGEPTRIAFVGDSITQGTGSGDHKLYSYPAQLQAMVNKDEYMVGNFGVAASGVLPSTRYYYNNTLQYHLIMEEFEPNIVSFALGTNDSLAAGGVYGVAQNFEKLYSELIKGVADLDSVANVYVATPILRLDTPTRQARNVSTVEPAIRSIVAKLSAEGYDITLFELNANTYEAVLAGDVLGSDKLHPDADGYSVMAQAFYDAIFNGTVDVPEGYYVDTFYVSDNGTETGAGTAEDPSSRYEVGLARLNKNGGSIIILDTYTIASDINTPVDIASITFKGATADAVLTWSGNTFKFGSDAVIDDLKLITNSDVPYIIGWYNDITIGENFTNEKAGKNDLGLVVGYFVYEAMNDETVTRTTYDTVESASSDKDVTIVVNNGTFGAIMLGNRRLSAAGPIGMYSGEMTVQLLGGEITGVCESTVSSGALTMMNLSGSISVTIDGMKISAPFYAVTRTATLDNIIYDSALNTGSIEITAPASVIDAYYVENERPAADDTQHAEIADITVNNTTALGDMDENGEITNADVTMLIRYLAGWTVNGASITGDMNADAKITNRDAIALIQKIA